MGKVVVLLVRDDGMVLGGEALTSGVEVRVERWTPDAAELARRLRGDAPLSAVISRGCETGEK